MKGTTIIIPADAGKGFQRQEHSAPLDLDFIQNAVGGFIEVVPQFKHWNEGALVLSCVAFCNEEGKNLDLPANVEATRRWAQSRFRQPVLLADHLAGDVLVVYGDDEFMGSL